MKTLHIVSKSLSLVMSIALILLIVAPLSAAPGDLDPTFGDNGKVITRDVGFSSAIGQDSALQADGKLVVVGWAMTGSPSNYYRTEFAMARYQPDGKPDESFGNGGQVTAGIDSYLGSRGRVVVIQPDGKILATGTAGLDFLVRYNVDGTLDNTFGTGGVMRPTLAQVLDLVVQADGKIITVGYDNPGNGSDVVLVRYNPNGSLDTTFGAAGKVLTDSGHDGDGAERVALQTDGKVVVAGKLVSGLGDDFALLRYNVDGTLDATFATNGIATLDFGGTNDVATMLQIQADGKLIVAGSAGDDFALARFTANGALDTTFGVGGKMKPSFVGDAVRMTDLAWQADGRIIATGTTFVAGKAMFAIVRYLADGSLDTGFGTDGWVVTNIRPELGSYGYRLVLQPDGKLLATGRATVQQTSASGVGFLESNWYRSAFATVRYRADGTLDATFGIGGEVITPFLRHSGSAYSLAVQPDGKILVAGNAKTNLDADFAVTRYDSNGKLDSTFGVAGRVVTDYLLSYDHAAKVLVQSDGKVLLAGDFDNAPGSLDPFGWVVLRYKQDGRLDPTFGRQGIALISSYPGFMTDMLLQPDGKIVVLAQKDLQCLMGRLDTTGALDAAFGQNGWVTISFGQDEATCNAIALQADGKIVVAGGHTSMASGTDFVVMRYHSNGTPDTTFGKQGVVITDAPRTGEAFSIVVQADGKLVIAGNYQVLINNDALNLFVLLRYNSDGAPDKSFGSDGLVTTTVGNSAVHALVVQPDGKLIAVGTDDIFSRNSDFAVVRYNSNGSLDASFGGGGVVKTDFADQPNFVYATALQADGKLLAAGFSDWDEGFVLARYLTRPDLPISNLNVANSSPTQLGNATNFTATVSAGTNIAYQWNFGDGQNGRGGATTHTYAATGMYTVIVTATNSLGHMTAMTPVTVTDMSVTGLHATNSGPTQLGNMIVFTATIDAGANVTYQWDFGDGQNGTGTTVTHTYAKVGQYTVVVTATNSLGSTTTTMLVTITDTPVSGLRATNSSPTQLGNTTTFTATIGGGSNVAYAWNFGDGQSGNGATAMHTYAAAGSYSAIVTATNSLGSITATTPVIIAAVPSTTLYLPVIRR